MIVVLNKSGRLCNRLLHFAHTCSTALASGQRYVHLMANDVMQFAEMDHSVLHAHGIYCLPFIPICGFLLRIRDAFYERVRPFNKKKYSSGNEKRAIKLSRTSIWHPHVITCWFYRDNVNLIKQRECVCKILRPKAIYKDAPQKFARSIRLPGNVLVGVHVRRGDYREFDGGKYFFSDSDYMAFIKQAQSALPRGAQFVMVSDEQINENYYVSNGVAIHVFHGGDFREDLVMLSICDYVMGPWSSFSWWAAYYGGGKLCHLRSPHDRIDIESFREVTGCEV